MTKNDTDPRSIRDVVLAIETRLTQLAPQPAPSSRVKAFPAPLTQDQRDTLDIVCEEIAKPFTLEELFIACRTVDEAFPTRNPETSQSARAYLTERAGLSVRWRK